MSRYLHLAGALAALGLAGCGSSPPTSYYTLAPVPPSGEAAATSGAPIRVDAVTIPAELDRLQLVRRADETRLDVAPFDRWAAPLDEQIRRVLSEDLTARLPGRVIGPAAPSVPAGTRLVAVDIDRFDADEGGHVVLSADWSLVADNKALQRHAERVEVATGGTQPADAPPAMSRAIGLLADRIAAQLQSGADR